MPTLSKLLVTAVMRRLAFDRPPRPASSDRGERRQSRSLFTRAGIHVGSGLVRAARDVPHPFPGQLLRTADRRDQFGSKHLQWNRGTKPRRNLDLLSTRGTGDFSQGLEAYKIGANISTLPIGWKRYFFSLDATSTSIPPG